jgi:hypothetical protein
LKNQTWSISNTINPTSLLLDIIKALGNLEKKSDLGHRPAQKKKNNMELTKNNK